MDEWIESRVTHELLILTKSLYSTDLSDDSNTLRSIFSSLIDLLAISVNH